MTVDLGSLVAELESLYRALGAALGADPTDIPTRSVVTRSSWLWCDHHGTRHRPDQWAEDCTPGADPGPDLATLAGAALVRPTLTATARRGDGARSAPGSQAPLDLDILRAQEAIWTAATDLVEDLRYRLGHARRERGMTTLARVPMLVDQLTEGGPWPRWVEVGIERLHQARARACEQLDIDLRPLRLDPCPSDRQPYTAAWAPDGTPLAEFVDGVCREYDWVQAGAWTAARWREDRTAGPVDVWRPSRLYVRNPAAPIESEAAAIRCPGCRRTWTGVEGRAQLFDLIHGYQAKRPA